MQNAELQGDDTRSPAKPSRDVEAAALSSVIQSLSEGSRYTALKVLAYAVRRIVRNGGVVEMSAGQIAIGLDMHVERVRSAIDTIRANFPAIEITSTVRRTAVWRLRDGSNGGRS